jgi:DNA-binding PadR family transcriptional regulator
VTVRERFTRSPPVASGGLIRGKVEGKAEVRQRQVFRLTSTGTAALKKWLMLSLEHDDVVCRFEEVLLRFAFMDSVIGQTGSMQFLKSLEHELKAHIPTLRQYLESTKGELTLSGRLALESGIRGYEARLRWAKEALESYGACAHQPTRNVRKANAAQMRPVS